MYLKTKIAQELYKQEMNKRSKRGLESLLESI